jgi:NAD-dependent dihydropyrimidine dehydrogenase PreA subunit
MDDQDKAVVLSADACTGCMLCELRCPDLAIQVFGDGVAHGNVAGGAGDG